MTQVTGTIATVSDALCTAKPSTAERTARDDKTRVEQSCHSGSSGT